MTAKSARSRKQAKQAPERHGRWNDEEAAYIRQYYGLQSLEEIGRHVGRSARAVQLYCLRHKLLPVGAPQVKRNLLVELLKLRFRNLEDFTPSRAFYNAVQMTQKRYWSLFYGRRQITSEEYARIADYLGITAAEAMQSRQLELFSEALR